MSFAFTHLVTAWFLGKGYEKYTSNKINHYAWFFLLFGSILPDVDFLLDWTLGTEVHRTFTHSLLFALLVPLILLLLMKQIKFTKEIAAQSSLLLSLGILSHFALDMFFSYGVPLLWPNLLYFSWTAVQQFNPTIPSFLHSPYENLQHSLILAVLDMAVGTTWIFFLWFTKRLKFS